MPIQANFKQDNGTTPTYHVIVAINNSFYFNNDGLQQEMATAVVDSWQDQSYCPKKPRVARNDIDVTALLSMPPPQPSGNVRSQMVGTVEQYLIAVHPSFAGGSQVL